MLQALGFTYADILPLHRWMGVAFIVWSTIHTICYILYYVHFKAFWRNFNFDGTTRGPQNMIALVAYVSLTFCREIYFFGVRALLCVFGNGVQRRAARRTLKKGGEEKISRLFCSHI